AEREVRDRLTAHRDRQSDPVVERRIDDLVAGERTGLVRSGHVTDLPAPSLHERDAQRAVRERWQRPAQRRLRQLVQLLRHERSGALDLDPAKIGAAEYVTAVDARARDLGKAVDPGREIGAHVALQSARARGRTDQAELLRIAASECARVL